MKKLVYGAALLVAAAGSFAFLPKAEEPTGCMLVIGTVYFGFSNKAAIVTVAPDGTTVEEAVSINGRNSSEDLARGLTMLRIAEQHKLQELTRVGWTVKSTFQQGDVGQLRVSQTTYVLEKR
ncbi:MAG: hypothetical protein H7330_03380 [Hymenobacteraceae bacterium]|nr:hypothetical protein [Hymenobacteraceae bacterium]